MQSFQADIAAPGFAGPTELPVTVLPEVERHIVLNRRKRRVTPAIVGNRYFDSPGHPNIGIEPLHEIGSNAFHKEGFTQINDQVYIRIEPALPALVSIIPVTAQSIRQRTVSRGRVFRTVRRMVNNRFARRETLNGFE